MDSGTPSFEQLVRDRITWVRMGGRLAFIFLCCAALYLSLAKAEHSPDLGFSWDKLNHSLGYFLLAASLDVGFRTGRHLVAKCLFVLSYSMMIECAQLYFPYREFSLLDMTANAFGIACYSLLLPYLNRSGIYACLRESSGVQPS